MNSNRSNEESTVLAVSIFYETNLLCRAIQNDAGRIEVGRFVHPVPQGFPPVTTLPPSVEVVTSGLVTARSAGE